MVAWTDTRVARWFAGGPAPQKITGRQYTQQCWADFLRTLGAVSIAAGIIVLITWWVNDPTRTEALTGWIRILGMMKAAELLWSLSYTIWLGKASPKTIPASR